MRIVLGVIGGVTLLGVLAGMLYYVFYRPHSAFQHTFAARTGGFAIEQHRLLRFDPLFPADAWRLRHSSAAFQALWALSNFGRMPFPRDVEREHIVRREIERTFSLPARSLDSHHVYFGDERCISQTFIVSPDQTESYFIAAGYL